MLEQQLRSFFAKSDDVIMKSSALGGEDAQNKVLLIYCEGMSNRGHLEQLVMPQLHALFANHLEFQGSELDVNTMLQLNEMTGINEPGFLQRLSVLVYRGELALFFEQSQRLYTLDIASPPNRSPEESATETAIMGVRDGFIEDIRINIALIRKRLLTNSLCCEKFDIGRRSHTTVALLYLDDVINKDVLADVKSKLQRIDVDGLVSSAQLEESLSERKYPFFPLLNYAGRPDFIVESLLKGRFTLLVDGNPLALVAPANLFMILKSPEDLHFPFYYVAFERVLRIAGLIIAALLPGFWIALSAYNIEQLPFPLVATISSSRLGLPLSGPIDFILMIILFELFREAGMRLPKAVGQTVTVVGGLIVGDAAIRAGVTSPTTLMVTSVSTIAMFTLVNQSLSGTITVLRIIILFLSTLFGIFGFMLGLFGVVLYLSTLESFGIPYLAPVSPPTFKDIVAALFQKPWKFMKQRPDMLQTEDNTSHGDDQT